MKKKYAAPRVYVAKFKLPTILTGTSFDTDGTTEGDADGSRSKNGGGELWDYAEDAE